MGVTKFCGQNIVLVPKNGVRRVTKFQNKLGSIFGWIRIQIFKYSWVNQPIFHLNQDKYLQMFHGISVFLAGLRYVIIDKRPGYYFIEGRGGVWSRRSQNFILDKGIFSSKKYYKPTNHGKGSLEFGFYREGQC